MVNNMNNKGSVRDNSLFRRIKIFANKVETSYIYKLVSKILSFLGTILLIFLVVIGSLMFYFNSKAKAYQRQGVNYVPPFGLYTIISGSMEPSIHVYDVVVSVSEKDLSKVKVGDIITFISTWDVNYGKTITHRVVSVSKNTQGEYNFTTKGDNNEAPDGATVSQANFVGKVVMRIPQLGRLQFLLATKMGWFSIVFIPALGVIIYDVFKILKLVVLKKEINNVSDVGNINPDGTFKEEYIEANAANIANTNLPASENINALPETQVFTEGIQDIATIENPVPTDINEPNVTIETIDQNAIPVVQESPAPIGINEPSVTIETVDQNTIPSALEVSQAAIVEPLAEVNAAAPANNINLEAPDIKPGEELDNVELPMISNPQTEVNKVETETTPVENNINIVQTSKNRAPILRRDQRNENKETNEIKPVEESKTNVQAKAVDLEDLQNIVLPVMKANANSDDGGPLTKRN